MPTTTSLQLGHTVPAFALRDTDGAEHHVPLADAPPATVLVVTCLHCPYVIAWNPRLRAVAEEYAQRGVRFLGIHANDATRYPADSLDHIKRFVREHGWPYPYLHDDFRLPGALEGARQRALKCARSSVGRDPAGESMPDSSGGGPELGRADL